MEVAFHETDSGSTMAMKKKTDCRQYRIGDFARYLGVTAEFLKHYQESGLLDVTQRASGYRYYPKSRRKTPRNPVGSRSFKLKVRETHGLFY